MRPAGKPLRLRTIVLLVLAFVGGTFLSGAAFVHYKSGIYTWIISSPELAELTGNAPPPPPPPPPPKPVVEPPKLTPMESYLEELFRRPLVTPEDQLYPPITTVNKIGERIRAENLAADALFTAYETLSVTGSDLATSERSLLTVSFELQGNRQARAYQFNRLETAEGPACANLIIPGSGRDQAYEIARAEVGNYQAEVLPASQEVCDSFVFMKPFESLQAMHNGEQRIDYLSYIVYMLNQGGSYSSVYLTQALAILKHLKTQYPSVFVTGLSQGGAASLVLARLAEPTGAIVASGYSVLNDHVDFAGPTQLTVPGLFDLTASDALKTWMTSTETRLLFTWGQEEPGVYGVEVAEQNTCKAFRDTGKVECRVHPGGHAYDLDGVKRFLTTHR